VNGGEEEIFLAKVLALSLQEAGGRSSGIPPAGGLAKTYDAVTKTYDAVTYDTAAALRTLESMGIFLSACACLCVCVCTCFGVGWRERVGQV